MVLVGRGHRSGAAVRQGGRGVHLRAIGVSGRMGKKICQAKCLDAFSSTAKGHAPQSCVCVTVCVCVCDVTVCVCLCVCV